MIFKKIIYSYNIQIKDFYVYKLVRAAKQYEKMQQVVKKESQKAV